MKVNSSDNTVRGFKAGAVAAGLKKGEELDLALIFSERESSAAGVFTNNMVRAAPVILSQENIANGTARAIVANAGNANACTGKDGLSHARQTTELAARLLGIRPDEILVASTGVIGQPLDMDLIRECMDSLVKGLSTSGIMQAAEAIMTTDSFPKISRFAGQVGKQEYRILGMAKGAGMIMPDMATMLCFILSDISIEPDKLKKALLASIETTFNRITVDGDTSTNDMVLVMANGMAGNRALSDSDYSKFKHGLQHVMGELALMIVRDGEGATKVVHIHIHGARSASDALNAARTVANSNLVKTAFYGQDVNWGRIMGALGRAGIAMEEAKVDIWIDDVQIVGAGLGMGDEAENKAAKQMARKEFSLTVDIHEGPYKDSIITCDLTHEYVTINANYRT